MNKKKIFVLLIVCCLMLSGCGNRSTAVRYTSLQDFSGKTIGVQTGTLYEDHLKKKVPDAVPQFFTDPNTMIVAVQSGKLDGYITDDAGFHFEKKSVPTLAVVNEPLSVSFACVGIGKTEKQALLLAQMNAFIAECRENGVLEELVSYWIDNGDEDKNAVDRSGITGESGKLIIGVEGGYIPFSYMNGGKIEGYDVDFAYRFCRRYGYEPVIESMDYDAISPALATGKCDLGMNIIYDEEREEAISLSDTYHALQIVIAYNSGRAAFGSVFEKIARSFEKTFIKDNRWKEFASGALVSLALSASSVILGTLCGLGLYVLCRNGKKVLNKIVDGVSWLVEGTPAVLLLMIFYFIIFGNVNIEKIVVAIISFTIVFTVSMFSMLKSGEIAVDPGQRQAALSQGFTEHAAYFRIILPQSAIHFLPQYFSETVSLIKETSIVGYIAILDLTKVSDMIRGRTFEPFFPLISTAVIYFMISWLLTFGAKKLYKSLCPETRSLKRAFRGIET